MTDSGTVDLNTSILTHLSIRTLYRGEILFPCIPAALGSYVAHIDKLLRNLGQGFSADQRDQVYMLLHLSMHQGYAQSPNAQIVFKYEVKGTASLQKTLECEVSLLIPSLAEHYDTWYQLDQTQAIQDGMTPLFGQNPDAKVMAIAQQLQPKESIEILDIGAGDGRNSLPLAQLGFRVHALDLSPEFTADLQRKADQAQLPIQVSTVDILDSSVALERDRYDFIILSEVTSHFRSPDELRHMFQKTCSGLKPNGLLLINCFVANQGFEPDEMAVQMSQIAWSSLFMQEQVLEAIASLPLTLMSDESAVAYEKQHLSPEHWPPTPWYEDWATGRSTFPFLDTDPPMELRWLLYQKAAS